MWHHRQGATPARGLAVGGTVVALVGHDGTGLNAGAEVHQSIEVRAIGSLAASQVKGDGMTVEV